MGTPHTIVNPKTGRKVLKKGRKGKELRAKHSDAALARAKEKRAQKLKKSKTSNVAANAVPAAFPSAREMHTNMRWPLGTVLVMKGVQKKLKKNDATGAIFWGSA